MADPISITISAASLCLTVGMFSWQHLRRVDAAICTLVASDCSESKGTFQFSVANLGTRAMLLREVNILAFTQPQLFGQFAGDCTTIQGILPQVIKAGEIHSTTTELKWQQAFLLQARKEVEDRGGADTNFYFVARVVVWNPKGQRLVGQKHIATLRFNHHNQGTVYEALSERAFRLKKVRDRWRIPKAERTPQAQP